MFSWLTNLFAAGDDRVVVVRISGQEDLSRKYDMLERYLKRPIERLDGVARVSLEGVEPLELRILVDPVRLAAHRVDVQTLRQMLESANFSVSAGEITGGGERLLAMPRQRSQSPARRQTRSRHLAKHRHWPHQSRRLGGLLFGLPQPPLLLRLSGAASGQLRQMPYGPRSPADGDLL